MNGFDIVPDWSVPDHRMLTEPRDSGCFLALIMDSLSP
jgi:hypothetical protein